MPDYKNGKIYCIRSYQTDDVYIGSTIQQLCKRMTDHRRKYKNWLKGKCAYITSYEIIKMGDAYIELLESFACSCREELHKKEGEYIRNTKCVNKRIAGRTKKEWCENNKDKIKEYRKKNKDKIAKKQKEWNENNKDKIAKIEKKYREKNKDKIAKKDKEYREKNKDKIAKRHKEYREKNKDKLAAKTPCPHCGNIMRKSNITRHIRESCKKVPK